MPQVLAAQVVSQVLPHDRGERGRIGQTDADHAVHPSGAQQCGVDVCVVGGAADNHRSRRTRLRAIDLLEEPRQDCRPVPVVLP